MNNRWSCLVTAASEASGISVPRLIKLIGHDGSAVVRPELEEPFCRRAFTFAEIGLALLRHGIYATHLDFEEVDFYSVPWSGHVGVLGLENHAVSFRDFTTVDGRRIEHLNVYEVLLWKPKTSLRELSEDFLVRNGEKIWNRLRESLSGKQILDLPISQHVVTV